MHLVLQFHKITITSMYRVQPPDIKDCIFAFFTIKFKINNIYFKYDYDNYFNKTSLSSIISFSMHL